MSDRPIIQADFVKPNHVPSRSVVQLIFEVPEEAADHAMAILGGYPQSGTNRWCAIARLADKPETAEEAPETQTAPERVIASVTAPDKPVVARPAPPAEQTPAEPERPLKGGARAKRAGILCGDAAFQQWIAYHDTYGGWLPSDISKVRSATAEGAARYVRVNCQVKSRADLDHNELCGRIWDQIESDYRAAMEGRTTADLETMRDGR